MPDTSHPQRQMTALSLRLGGVVQGVGFRPFVFRVAQHLGVMGWVQNVTGAVRIHAEADAATLEIFSRSLISEAPAIARPELMECEPVVWVGHSDFQILPSCEGHPDIHVPPDYFVCPDCLSELRDPADRRYRYPFINCTQCGPRYTLITALPYDRPNTSMAAFALCPACQAEYDNPANRRFHAEPVACPTCGPRLSFSASVCSTRDTPLPLNDDTALMSAVTVLRQGGIVAVKGVGGYHLMCDARSDQAVALLRTRKHRPAKPLAVMFANMESLGVAAKVSPEAKAALTSPARPIVLLPRLAAHATQPLSTLLAPGLNEIGCFLAYSPLHVLLLETFGGPLVATSGNLSGEPVLTDNTEAQTRLTHMADAFLHHNRPIVRPADDSVLRFVAGKMRPLRLGRGLTPREMRLSASLPEPVMALGSHMKNTVCLAWGNRAVISPHIGELSAARSQDTLARVAEDLQQLYQVRASRLLTDAHPGYGHQHFARASGLPITPIWHHRAHASALAGEFASISEWIILAWDGVGLGEDGQLWGGEVFVGAPGRWQHHVGIRPFRLPGGEKAGREPWRSAAALLWECDQPATFAPEALHQAWQKGLNSPATHAVGRLFDAAAALTGICQTASFEGEGPMLLEAAAESWARQLTHLPAPPVLPVSDAPFDWATCLPLLMNTHLSVGERAWHFHAELAAAALAQAQHWREKTGITHVGLTGGVFQNRLLTELAATQLAAAGFEVHVPDQVPVNDAGLSFGQVIEYLHSPHE